MSERAKLLALLAIAGVEVPLMWRIFHYLEPQFLLSVIFTLPVSAAMVVVPHFAGAWYRARHATGADLLNRWVPLALLMPWALLAFFLGDLRRRVLLVPKMDARGHTYPSLSDHLDLNEYTVSAMFIALLLLTGGVAFMLGIANDHPIVSAYLGADERWRSVLDRLRGDRTTLAGAEQRLDSSTEQDNDRDRTARRQDLVEEAYAAAAEAYLDGVTDELANPTATDAAARSGERREAMPSSGSAAV
jgi:hypothetical protein